MDIQLGFLANHSSTQYFFFIPKNYTGKDFIYDIKKLMPDNVNLREIDFDSMEEVFNMYKDKGCSELPNYYIKDRWEKTTELGPVPNKPNGEFYFIVEEFIEKFIIFSDYVPDGAIHKAVSKEEFSGWVAKVNDIEKEFGRGCRI